jgi:NAD(P)-dependent dehydrogenase (short-subunit alcohol dehydrogenase family)
MQLSLNRALALVISALAVLAMPRLGLAESAAAQKAVLVTGASSGIGLKITEQLAAAGHHVYAGARKADDLARLDAMDNVTAVKLDVTVPADVDSAVAFIRGEGRGLWGLVNNAGVAALGTVAETTQEDLDFQFGVNVFGVHRVTRAFLPLIIESQGRITTIGSISGFIAEEDCSTYCMTKFAMEAFTDSLAAEMAPSGVTVNIVEPGSFKTPIWQKMADRQLAQAATGGEASAELQESAQGIVKFGAGQPEPDAVAAAVEQALFAESPKRRYMVTPDQEQALVTLQHAIRRVAELNQDQPFSYSRDALVKLLDEALEGL